MSRFTGRRRLALAVGLIAAWAANPAHAQPAPEAGTQPRVPHTRVGTPEPEFNTGRVSVAFGTDFATAYFFRGLLQEENGFVAQPWIELGINLYESEGAISSIDFAMGSWNSVHSKETGGAGSTVPPWFESDAYFTLSAGVFENFTLSLTYTALTSPNNAFSTIHELGGTIGYNDASFWESVGLSFPGFEGFQPYVTIIGELDGQADAPSTGGDEGIYLQIGVEPTILICEPIDLVLAIPLTAGFSIDNYYEDFADGDDDFFGYFDVGLVLSMPLWFIPPEFGAWELSAGVHFLFLGDTAEGYSGSGPAGRAWNGGDDFQVIGVMGFAMSY